MRSGEVAADTLIREVGSMLLFENTGPLFALHHGTCYISFELNVLFDDPFSSFDLFTDAVKPCPRQLLSIELVLSAGALRWPSPLALINSWRVASIGIF